MRRIGLLALMILAISGQPAQATPGDVVYATPKGSPLSVDEPAPSC
ncbi:hypothetical protein AB0C07_18670 [Actinoplanes missouriensis]